MDNAGNSVGAGASGRTEHVIHACPDTTGKQTRNDNFTKSSAQMGKREIQR